MKNTWKSKNCDTIHLILELLTGPYKFSEKWRNDGDRRKAHGYRKWKNKEEKVNLSDPWKSVLDNHEANPSGGKTYTSSLNICPDHPISQLIIRKIIKRWRNRFSPPRCFLRRDKAKRKKVNLRLMNGNN
jgi:hypothetical protein